jgi:hypothetical protein
MAVHTHSASVTTTTAADSACKARVDAPKYKPSHHSATSPMSKGSTMTSRDIHEVRHMAAARQARAFWPR